MAKAYTPAAIDGPLSGLASSFGANQAAMIKLREFFAGMAEQTPEKSFIFAQFGAKAALRQNLIDPERPVPAMQQTCVEAMLAVTGAKVTAPMDIERSFHDLDTAADCAGVSPAIRSLVAETAKRMAIGSVTENPAWHDRLSRTFEAAMNDAASRDLSFKRSLHMAREQVENSFIDLLTFSDPGP